MTSSLFGPIHVASARRWQNSGARDELANTCCSPLSSALTLWQMEGKWPAFSWKSMIACSVCYCGLQSHKKRHHSKEVLLSSTGNLWHERGFTWKKNTRPLVIQRKIDEFKAHESALRVKSSRVKLNGFSLNIQSDRRCFPKYIRQGLGV